MHSVTATHLRVNIVKNDFDFNLSNVLHTNNIGVMHTKVMANKIAF